MKNSKKPGPVGKAQIAARVAPATPKKNEIKKVYKEGSPGYRRKLIGNVTLTQLKKSVNELALDYTTDGQGNVTEVPYRATAACTLRRREMTRRELLGASSKTHKQRRKNNRYAACNVKKQTVTLGEVIAKAIPKKKGK
jgi:hypothetical protein